MLVLPQKQPKGVPQKEGDFSLCAHCGHILRFDSELNLISATPEDMVEFFEKNPDGYHYLLQAQRAFKSPYWQEMLKNYKK